MGPQEKSGGMLIIRSLNRSSTSARAQGENLGAGRERPFQECCSKAETGGILIIKSLKLTE
jgi:hypothetical protein